MRNNHRMETEAWRPRRPVVRSVNRGVWDGTPMARPREAGAARYNRRLPDPHTLWIRFKSYFIRTLSSYLNPNEARHIPGTFDMRPRRPSGGLYGPFGIRGETILLLAVIAAVIACLVLSTLLVKTVWASIRTDAASAEPVATKEAPVVVPAVPKKQINILLIGIDQRPNDASFRTDVMLLVMIDPNNSKVTVVSFPRDLWVQVPSLYEMKINEVMQMGGWEALAEAYQVNFGVKPDYYVSTNFNGFTEFIDNRGGVDVEVTQGLTDSCDLVWQRGGFCTVDPGTVHMDGATALWYVRSRHTSSDLDRLRREQEVVYAVFKKMMRLKTFSQLGQMKEELGNNVETNLGIDRVLGLVPIGLQVFKDPSSVKKFAVGEEQADEMISWNGQWILLPKEGAIPKLLKKAGFK